MTLLRFGPFTLRPDTGDLKRDGVPVRLRRQPTQILALLVQRAGDLVTRQEIIDAVWPGTTVEYDQGLNSCMRQIRRALGDDADAPVWIETIPRQGYRFLPAAEAAPCPSPALAPRSRWKRMRTAAAVCGVVLLLAGSLALLRAWNAAPEQGSAASRVAILPLRVADGDSGAMRLGDALVEGIIDHLARIDPTSLGVIARTSVQRFRETTLSAREIGVALGASHLVEGSIARAGDSLRVTLRLIRTRDQTQQSASAFSGSFESIERDMPRLAGTFAGQIVPSLTAATAPAAEPIPPPLRDAYLQARYLIDRRDAGSAAAADTLLRAILAIAPRWAPAHGALARARFLAGEWLTADSAALQATRMDSLNVESHLVHADIALLRDGDFQGAESSYARALALAPGNAEAHNAYAFLLVAAGRFADAISHAELAESLDPVSPLVHGDVGYVYFWAGRPAEAVPRCRRSLVLDPDGAAAEDCLIMAFEALGQPDSSLAHARRLVGLIERGKPAGAAETAPPDLATYWRWWIRRLSGRSDLGSWGPYQRALAHLGLGMPDSALGDLRLGMVEHRRLERVPGAPPRGLYVMLGVDPRFAPLRANQDFRGLLAAAGLSGARVSGKSEGTGP